MSEPKRPVDLFMACLEPVNCDQLDNLDDLDQRLARAWTRAREAWPDLEVSQARYLAFLAGRLGKGAGIDDLGRLIDEAPAADMYLACGCTLGHEAALARFGSVFGEELRIALRRAGVPDDLIEELVQTVLERVLTGSGKRPARIAQYDGDGSLRAWIRVIAIRLAINLMRRRAREQPMDEAELARRLPVGQDHELEYFKRLYAHEFKTAFHTAFDALTARERNLLRYQLLDELTLDQIGLIHKVHKSTVSRWLTEIRKRLADLTRQALMEQAGVGNSQFDSVVRLIHSQMDASVIRLLGEED